MHVGSRLSYWLGRASLAFVLFVVACGPTAAPSKPAAEKPAEKAAAEKPAEKPVAAKPAGPPTLEELYEKAKAEGGKVTLYTTLAQVNAEKLFPIFNKRFPDVQIEHVDATGDKLLARAIAESRGGKVLGDVFETDIQYVSVAFEQKILQDDTPPEGAAFADNLKGSYWNATDFVIMIGAWNTNLVPKADEPKSWEDLADPKWKGKLIGEPRDVEILLGLARYKYKDDAKAEDIMRKIAANNPEFHNGHSDLAELLVAGQAAACFSCYSHHYPPRIAKGAPVGYWLTEGVAQINGTALFKDPPHPNAAMLWHRWIISEEGQQGMATAGRTPAHPKVQPLAKTRPDNIYPLSANDLKDYPRYEKLWKEIFQLR
jgi:iron(III) transport system substrate-binding protein